MYRSYKSTLVNKPCLKEHYLGVLDPWFLETLVGDTEQGSKKVEIILVIDKELKYLANTCPGK